MLDGRRILVTGVLDRHSIAFATAARAQELGAEVLLTGFGRTKRMTERAAAQLPTTAEVRELDVNSPSTSSACGQSSRSAGERSTGSCTRSPTRRPTRSAAASWTRPSRAP